MLHNNTLITENNNVFINCSRNNYHYDPVNNLNFSNYITTKNIRLSWGYNSIDCEYKNNMINIAIYFEEPNFLIYNDIDYSSNNYDIKLTLCKYTANEFNEKYKNTNKKCFHVFFPIDEILLTNNLWNKYNYNLGCYVPNWKQNNIIYTGHEISPFVKDIKKLMNNYNNYKIDMPSYISKMDAYLHSKIAIVHNILFFENEKDHENVKNKLPVFKNDNYVNGISKNNIPQLKSRLFEAASSQCIILCYRDDFNLIEDYFTKGEDFFYFHSIEHLENLIQKILSDYNNYAYIGLNAYNKWKNNYTLKHFCDKFINIY
jgi:glycosyltransferase involved in cell wall biosynthesis